MSACFGVRETIVSGFLVKINCGKPTFKKGIQRKETDKWNEHPWGSGGGFRTVFLLWEERPALMHSNAGYYMSAEPERGELDSSRLLDSEQRLGVCFWASCLSLRMGCPNSSCSLNL